MYVFFRRVEIAIFLGKFRRNADLYTYYIHRNSTNPESHDRRMAIKPSATVGENGYYTYSYYRYIYIVL